ncbi:hypothetical protein U14_00806 [Candidatus Moduliflexus flocculans]|uniref:CopG domain protein DNA-binding domain protein n=1 Tax=Candidatus Moduliflexus flocculans TaxID=1499966 RepID=A0A0S6VUW5_9BACT|nr:hypothetical protein U14_00806 [Candidatus Moduliflexus flocculans]
MTVTLQLPNDIARQIERAAQRQHVTMRQYILTTLQDTLSYQDAFEMLQEKLSQASPLSVDEILRYIPDRQPLPGDE